MQCIVCDTILSGKQSKFCSTRCKQKSINVRHQNYACQQQRGYDRRIKLVLMRGGECQICGYSKNLSALTFHHLNPSEKEFQIDIRKCSNSTWDNLVTEVEKCQLLCLNCHAEVHHPSLHLASPP